MKNWRISSTARPERVLLPLALLTLLLALLSLGLGAVPISPIDVLRALLGSGEDTVQRRIVLYVYLPRTCGGLLAGMALAVSGTVIQSVLANPLAAPNIIGVNAGAGLSTALCCAVAPKALALTPIAAFLGALAGVMLVLFIAERTGAARITLVLAGAAVSSMFGAGVDAVLTFFPDSLNGYSDFRIGGLSNLTMARIIPAFWVVLDQVSLTFPDGQITALLGPNGCGKSTLLRTVMGLHPLSGGQVLVDGIPSGSLTSRQLARQLAYLPQSRGVPNITARRMVLHGRFPYLSYPRRYRRKDYEMAAQALQWVGAEELADCPVQQLSGGQRQKVYLAMALAQDTKTIFMDEPTTFLDVGAQMEVMALARRLAGEGKAVGMVLHDLPLALRWFHQAAVLDQGKLHFCGTPEEVFSSGVLEDVFGVKLGRLWTEKGWQYYYD